MIETIRRSIHGPRAVLEELQRFAGIEGELVDYPARSALYVKTLAGSKQDRIIEEYISRFHLDAGRYAQVTASPEELATEALFNSEGGSTTDDMGKVVAEPAYSGRDACPHCGKRGIELLEPLRVFVKKLRNAHLVWSPPGLFLGSTRLADTIREQAWTGVDFATVLDRATGEPTDAYVQLIILSVLAPMHPSVEITLNGIPNPCQVCRGIGYRRVGWQVPYARSVLETAADWNVSSEWLSPNAVSFPELICRQRVVHELLKLDPRQKWIPVKLVD